MTRLQQQAAAIVARAERDERMRESYREMYDALRAYVEWGAMTGSDRDLHESKFRALLARIDGDAK